MKITACDNCTKPFTALSAPCPDGREGCLVAHYNKQSWTCPHCGHDMGPAVAKSISEGRHTMDIGIGIGNVASIAKLELHSEPEEPTIVVLHEVWGGSEKGYVPVYWLEDGKIVYAPQTEWERKTLIANKFKLEDASQGTYSMKDEESGMARIIAGNISQGGLG